jgi:rhodanese-related sulfurtransferase
MRFRITRLITLTLAGSLLLAACGSDSTAAVVETVDAGTAAGFVADAETVLLDIRTPEEFTEARIDGAVNIDFYAPDFAEQIADLDRDTTYVVYCRSGNRSGQAMELFRDLEFNDVHEIGGGILAWLDAGLATVSG